MILIHTPNQQKVIELFKNAANGKLFEDAALAITWQFKNTTRILVDKADGAAYRVPDILDLLTNTIGEIKGTAILRLSKQMKDFIKWADDVGATFQLYVKPSTVLDPKLVDELKRIGAEVFDVDIVKGTATRRAL